MEFRRDRRRRWVPAMMMLAAIAAAAPVAQARPIETIVQDDALMLHGSEEEIRRGMQRARDLGIDRVRLTAGWDVIAPSIDLDTPPEGFDAKDPAAYPAGNWDNLDRAVRLAHEAGLAPMIDIAFWAPKWASKDPAEIHDRRAAEIDPHHYAQFAEAVARRYSGSWTPPPAPSSPSSAEEVEKPARTILDHILGTPPEEPDPVEPATPEAPAPLPAVDTFTIWNEPNHSGFLRPQWAKVDGQWVPRSPEIYRAMVRAAYPAIKAISPQSRVLIGGTASMGSSTPGTGHVPPLRFLRALACVDEALQPVTTGTCAGYQRLPGDGWSHHPYSLRTTPDVDPKDRDKLPVAGTRRLADTLRTLVDRGRLDPRAADIYMTEFGYETNRPDPNAPFKLEEQGRLLAWAEFIATSVPSVRSWPQFQLYDRPDGASRPGMRPFGDWHSGLYFNDGTPKPAAATYATPIHATCVKAAGGRWTMVWGRLRGRKGSGRLEVRRNGDWRAIDSYARPGRRGAAVASVAAQSGAAVRRYVRYQRGTSYRLRWTASGDERASAASAPTGRACAAAGARSRRRN